MIHPTSSRKFPAVLASAALAAGLLSARARAATLTWDADPAQPAAQGGPGTWANGAGGWFDGTGNVNWNNANLDSALFAGTAGGAIDLPGLVTAQHVTFDTPGYTLSGGGMLGVSGGVGTGVYANTDVTINAPIRPGPGVNGWYKDGAGTLTLGGTNNVAAAPMHLKAGTVAFADKSNLPGSITLDGNLSSRLLYTGGAASADVTTALNVQGFAAIDVPDAATRLNWASEIRGGSGGGLLVKRGAGTIAPTYTNSNFIGTFRVDEGALLLQSSANLNKRPLILTGTGTALLLRADAATDFGSTLTSRGTSFTIDVDRGTTAGPTTGTHALAGISNSGTLSLTSGNRWGLTVGTVTNSGTIDLNNTRLTVTSALAPVPGGTAAGTIRFAHDPSPTPDTNTRGLWLATATSTTVTSTFAGQTDDADLLVGAAGSGTVATNLTLDGSWGGGGAAATSTLVLPRFGNIAFGPNLRFNNLPADPAAAPRPLRLWGSGSTFGGVLTFDPAFVADRTNNGATPDGLAAIDLSNVTWETHHTQGLPVVARPIPGGAGTYRTGLVTFDNFSNVSGSSTWAVKTNDQTYDGGVHVKHTGQIALEKNLTLTGRVTPYADNHLRVAANRMLTVVGGGDTLTLSGDLGFAPGSRLAGSSAVLVFNTDPGAGWYDGNYARDPAAGTVTPPAAPSHTLRLSIGNLQGLGGAIFNAPVTRLAELHVGGTATVSLSLPAGPQKVLSVSSLLRFSPTESDNALDLADNAMILGAGTNHTSVAVRAMLTSGDLHSSAADARHALGYARAADVLPAPPAGESYAFLGLPVGADDVLVRYTLLGDADLSGAVNFDDLLRLAANYNRAADAHWSIGDFDYSGAVNFDDLLILAANYNAALPTAPVPGAPPTFAADLAAAFAQVPEPSAPLALAACAAGLLARRRRHRP